jgi:hypothetical protein
VTVALHGKRQPDGGRGGPTQDCSCQAKAKSRDGVRFYASRTSASRRPLLPAHDRRPSGDPPVAPAGVAAAAHAAAVHPAVFDAEGVGLCFPLRTFAAVRVLMKGNDRASCARWDEPWHAT